MRIRVIFLLAIIGLTFSCSSNSIVGKWRFSEKYSRSEKEWKPVSDEMTLEFSSDGKYTLGAGEAIQSGPYSVDQAVNPSRLVLTGEALGEVNMIFKIEGRKLTLKAVGKGGSSPFPTDFEPVEDDFELSTLERE